MKFMVIATNYEYRKVKKVIKAPSADYIRRNHLKHGLLGIHSIKSISEPKPITPPKRRIPAQLNPEHVQYWLLINELTVTDLADMYGCSKTTICNRLKALNRDDVNEKLKGRHQTFMRHTKFKNVEGRRRARELVLMGWKPAAIIHETHCCTKTVYGLVHELRELL